MLLPLISVLVLLIVGFSALWIGVTGRVSGPESSELHPGGRALVTVVALLAFGAAYLIYRLPQNKDELIAKPPLAAMPSAPIETETTMAESVKNDDEAAIKDALLDVNAEEPADSPEDALSAAPALLESEVRQPSARSEPVEPPAPPKPAPSAVAIAKTASPPTTPTVNSLPAPVRTPKRRSTSTPREPLTLHVHNSLGRDQQFEQLTLSIEGLPVADLVVDDQNPAITVGVRLPRPGLLHYRLDGISGGEGNRQLVGQGCIRVRDGARFSVRRRPGSDKVFLQSTRVAP